jgi:putative RNA 2'-phosphotransferase
MLLTFSGMRQNIRSPYKGQECKRSCAKEALDPLRYPKPFGAIERRVCDMRRSRSPQILAKMLAYVLGRRPDEFGLIPDAEGFVATKDLLKALHEEEDWRYVNESHLREVLLTAPASLFESDGRRIRIRQRPGAIEEPAAMKLPKLLYVAIRRRAHPHVHANGILPSSHPRVVLAAERDLAERLGRRFDPDPVILTVNVASAEEHGVAFSRSGAGLFLADHIPAGCFSGPPLPKEKPQEASKPRRPDEPADRPATPGSYLMDLEKAASPHVPEYLKRRTRRGRKIDSKRIRPEKWTREKPPWKS